MPLAVSRDGFTARWLNLILGYGRGIIGLLALGDRLVVGLQTLDLPAEVQILLPQPNLDLYTDGPLMYIGLVVLPEN